MRILHIGEVAGLGGLQNWICRVAEAQAKRGFHVELMQPSWASAKEQVFTELPVHAWDLKRTLDVDLVHSHGISGLENKTIRKRTRRPVVHTYYGTILGIQIALRWFQNLVGWNGFSTPRNIMREVAGGQSADAAIAISPKVAWEIKTLYRIAQRKISVIPGGYFPVLSDFDKQSARCVLGLPLSGFLFLLVGRDDPVKNLAIAVDAFRFVKQRFPDSRLIVAPKQDLPTFEGLISLELAPQDMGRLYRAVDACIHPSVYDGYSLAVHEACANSLPAIISPGCGIAAYCADGVNALILPRKRGSQMTQALAQKMCSLIQSPELRTALGREAARKFAPMDWDWVAAETERVYSSL